MARWYQQLDEISKEEKQRILEMHSITRIGNDELSNLKKLAPKASWSRQPKSLLKLHVEKYGPLVLLQINGEKYLGSRMVGKGKYWEFFDENDVRKSINDIAEQAGISIDELIAKLDDGHVVPTNSSNTTPTDDSSDPENGGFFFKFDDK